MDIILLVDGFLATFSPQLVMGAGALLGAAIRSIVSIIDNKKKLGKKFVLQPEKIFDTVWQSTATGVAFAMGLGASAGGIIEFIFAALAGAGADSLCNKAKVLNLFSLSKDWLNNYKSKKTKK